MDVANFDCLAKNDDLCLLPDNMMFCLLYLLIYNILQGKITEC